MKKILLSIIVLFYGVIALTNSSAAQSQSPQHVQVPWFGGAGEKPEVRCHDNAVVVGLGNWDYGGHIQTSYMLCNTLKGVKVGKTSRVKVTWTGGAGLKPTASCNDQEAIVGMSLIDLGHNIQHIDKIICADLNDTVVKSSIPKLVVWTGGAGEKRATECDEGGVMTSLAVQDFGNFNIAIGQVHCSFVANN